MTLKVGAKGFLKLGDNFEEPRWREALVVSIKGEWLQCLARCKRAEVDQAGLSKIENDEGIFCLVETPFNLLLSGVTGNFRALEADEKNLLHEGVKTVHSEEDLNFATASDAKPQRSTALVRSSKPKDSSSVSPSPSSAEEGGDLAAALRQKWLGSGTGKGRRENSEDSGSPPARKRTSRFAMIERKSKKKEKSQPGSKELSQELMLRAASGSADPLQGLLALQLAQNLDARGKRSKKKHQRRSPSGSTSSSESDRGAGDRTLKGHSKAVKNYQGSKRRMFRDPVKYIKRYVRDIEEELGAADRPFRITDYNKKIFWGKNRTLQRCHYLVSVILEKLLKNEPQEAALQTCLTLQCLHQTSLDNGNWDIGWLLTHVENPFERRLFGGDPQNLQDVASYLKSMNELAKATQSLRGKGLGKAEQEEQGSEKAGKGNKKGQQKDKNKEKVQADA